MVNGAALLDRIPDRLRLKFQTTGDVAESVAANPNILLTGTQVTVHNTLVAALLNSSTPILLQGDAGLGKTTVLAAALLSVSDPSRQIIRLEGAGCGMDESFRTLFTKKRHGPRGHDASEARPECRVILVADQAESVPSGTFAYLDLLTRMPGREASFQTLIVGRPGCWDRVDGIVAERILEALPVRLTLPPLSEQDAWDLFHHRISSACPLRSARRVVADLLERSEGLPGRFDEVLKAAVASGLLQGVNS